VWLLTISLEQKYCFDAFTKRNILRNT